MTLHRKDKTMSAPQLARTIHDEDLKRVQTLPPGAVFRVPARLSKSTIQRFANVQYSGALCAHSQVPQEAGPAQWTCCEGPLADRPSPPPAPGILQVRNVPCVEIRVSLPSCNWELIVLLSQVRFSDEKRFKVIGDGPVRVWRKREDRYMAGYVRGMVQNCKSIMMWLCIAADGRSRLMRCDHRQDAESYRETVLRPNLNFIRRRGHLGDPIVFQHDNAPSHSAHSTQRWLAAHRVDVLPSWPPYSPDLNPVEHCWAYIARQMLGRVFKTEEDLEAAVREVWAQRPPELVPKLCGSMVSRMVAVQNAKGGNTRY